MPRLARIVIPDLPHHVTPRGNNRQDVFFVDSDRRVYLEFLKEQAEEHGVEVRAWCLMPNHVRLAAPPRSEESLANAIGRTHFRYTQYINRFHGGSGRLWQGRVCSSLLNGRARA